MKIVLGQNSFRHLLPIRIQSWRNKLIIISTALLFLCAAASTTNPFDSNERESRDIYYSLTPSPVTRIHRVSNGRLNSRFLTIPSLEFMHMARRDGQLVADHAHAPFHRPYSRHAGNSPVYYIRLPPAPYMFVPGLGYVSPHPYNTPIIPPGPVMMNPMGMMMGNGGGAGGINRGSSSGESDEDFPSGEILQNNVISLPLKFVSNGRPAQIQNPKKKKNKPKQQTSKAEGPPTKMTHLISGGKFSFNGRPNGVFIVNSPIDSPPSDLNNNALL